MNRLSKMVSLVNSTLTSTGGAKRWSDPATWIPGSIDPLDVPQAGDSFMIAPDSVIKLDVQTPALGNIICYGTIIVSNDVDTSIDSHSFMLMGTGKIVFADGIPGHYNRKWAWRPRGTITGSTTRMVTPTTGATAVAMGFFNNGSDRSFMIEDGGQILGGPPALTHHWRLAAHANIGDSFIKIRGTANVKAGDKFVISTTDFFGQSANEEMTVAADSTGDTITFTSSFTKFHWGLMQYVNETSTGVGHLSTTDEGWRPTVDAPYSFDEAAHVIRLNRSIVIDGSLDGDLGGRFMIHGNSGTIRIDGWEFSRMGVPVTQQWYGGVHHHMSSFEMPGGPNSPSNGNYIGGSLESSLCIGHIITNTSVHHSKNRGHVPHGANGVTYQHVVFYDVAASAIFFEEGSARKCVVDDWHAIKVRPVTSNPLQNFDGIYAGGGDGGAAAVWLTNPDNTLTNGSAGDVYTGVWNAFTIRNPDMSPGYGCFGLNKYVPFSPGDTSILNWDNNEVYAFGLKGTLTAMPQGDEAGNTADNGYPGSDGLIWTTQQTVKRMKFWKGGVNGGGYRNRVGSVNYLNPSSADVCGTLFNGAVFTGSSATNGMYIRESLNVTTRPSTAPVSDAPFFTYHGGLVAPGSVVFGFKTTDITFETEGTNGRYLMTGHGMFKFWSEYLYPITFWVSRTPGVKLINSDWGFRTPPQHLEQEAPYTGIGRPLNYDLLGDISGAILMTYPYLGGAANQWWTYDIPFMSFGAANPVSLTTTSGISNGLLTTTRFFGIGDPPHERYDGITYPRPDPRGYIDWRRLNPANLSEVDQWFSPGGNGSNNVRGVGFQHVAVANGGVYKLVTPDIPQSYWCSSVYGARDNNSDGFVLCIPFSGAKTARVAITNNSYDFETTGYGGSDFAVSYGYTRKYTAVTSGGSAANIIAGSPDRFWQDTANNCVWLKFRGGLTFANDDPNNPFYIPHTDEAYPQAQMYLAVSATP